MKQLENNIENDKDTENKNEARLPQNENMQQNSGWADAMAEILSTDKPKRKKTVVLSRANRVDVTVKKAKEKYGFEIDGEVSIEEDKKNGLETKRSLVGSHEMKLRIRKKDWATKGRVKPSILEKDREKALIKIATRGVVQLFNAVHKHQKTVSSEINKAGNLEYKKDRVLKSVDKKAFLDVLMGSAKSHSVNEIMETETNEVKKEEDKPEEKTWSILRDDFMMSTKFKDWDKEVVG